MKTAKSSQFSAKSVDDESYFAEDDQGDCVYVITYKKMYKNAVAASSSQRLSYDSNGSGGGLNPYGTYRLTTPLFHLMPHSETAASTATTTSTATSGDGLVYSRVKIRQLKYASLAKFVEHFTSDETGELDSSLVQTFLATYRTFTDAATVIAMLKQR